LQSVAVLGLVVVLVDAYNTELLEVWYLSIDIHFILFYVEFESGLSASVLKTGQLVTNSETGKRFFVDWNFIGV
jgi:hypothetical protein